MSGYKVEAIEGPQRNLLGEGPHWDVAKQELLYVDIIGKSIHKYVPKTGEIAKVDLDGPVSLIIPVEGQPDKYLISFQRDIQIMDWDGKSSKPSNLKRLYTVDDHCHTNKLNDGKCDVKGRLWAGSMGQASSPWDLDRNKGMFYSFDLDGKVVKHFDQLDISNGLAWSGDNNVLYYIDSFAYRIDAYDFDAEAGTLSNKRTAFDFKDNKPTGNFPDGMTIDANGNLWVAIFAAKQAVHIDPKVGKQIGKVDFPTNNITSLAFGGPNLEVLYATSASLFISPEELASQPTAGSLFQVTNVGAKGVAPFNYKGPI